MRLKYVAFHKTRAMSLPQCPTCARYSNPFMYDDAMISSLESYLIFNASWLSRSGVVN